MFEDLVADGCGLLLQLELDTLLGESVSLSDELDDESAESDDESSESDESESCPLLLLLLQLARKDLLS